MKKLYACDTTTFKRLNRYAVKAGYNRSMSDEGIAQLDPLGNHILENVLHLHTNHDGLVSMRARCMTKLKGKAAPTIVFLDISHKDWRKFVEQHSVQLEHEPQGKVVAVAAPAPAPAPAPAEEEELCENCSDAPGTVISEQSEALLLCQKCYEDEEEEELCENCLDAPGTVISEQSEALLLCQKCYEEEDDEDDEDLWMEIYSETEKFAELCGKHEHLKPYHNFRYLQCWGGGPEGGFLTDGTTLHKVNRTWGEAFTVFPQPGTLRVEERNGVKQCRIVL